jgi:hypothetical protein
MAGLYSKAICDYEADANGHSCFALTNGPRDLQLVNLTYAPLPLAV